MVNLVAISIIYENGLTVNPMRNLTIHDGLDKDANAVHFDESYEIKKLTCETININKSQITTEIMIKI